MRTALITGASSGIGRAIALELGRNDVRLYVAGRNFEALLELRGCVRRAHHAPVNIIREDLVHPRRVLDVFTLPDILVLSAGFGAFGNFEAQDLQVLQDMIDVNCKALVTLTHTYLPAMIDNNFGDILIVSSGAAGKVKPLRAVYSATKSFASSFGRSLEAELADTGVRVHVVEPGPTETNFFNLALSLSTTGFQGDTKAQALTQPLVPVDEVAKDAVRKILEGRP